MLKISTKSKSCHFLRTSFFNTRDSQFLELCKQQYYLRKTQQSKYKPVSSSSKPCQSGASFGVQFLIHPYLAIMFFHSKNLTCYSRVKTASFQAFVGNLASLFSKFIGLAMLQFLHKWVVSILLCTCQTISYAISFFLFSSIGGLEPPMDSWHASIPNHIFSCQTYLSHIHLFLLVAPQPNIQLHINKGLAAFL